MKKKSSKNKVPQGQELLVPGKGKDKGVITVVAQQPTMLAELTAPTDFGKQKVSKIINEVAEEAAKSYLMRTTLHEIEGFDRKTLGQMKTFYKDILENSYYRFVNHAMVHPKFQGIEYDTYDYLREKFRRDLEIVFQRQFQNYKQFLYNTRTKPKTLAEIYNNLKSQLQQVLKAHPAPKKQTLYKFKTVPFARMLIDGYIELFLKHPKTPTAVINSIVEDLKAFLKSGDAHEHHRNSSATFYTIDDYLIPYLQDVLMLPKLGKKGVDAIIRGGHANVEPKNSWLYEALARNQITTGDQLTVMFNKLRAQASLKPNANKLEFMEPAFSAIARNRKLDKKIRDIMMMKFPITGTIDLGPNCTPDVAMNIRMALASNPNLPKKDLEILAEDPCVSVVVIARHHLKRRFKR